MEDARMLKQVADAVCDRNVQLRTFLLRLLDEQDLGGECSLRVRKEVRKMVYPHADDAA